MSRMFIDVREPFEFAASHVKGALNLPPSQLIKGAAELNGVPKDTELIVYCRTGSRSNVAINILTDLGYTNAINGINESHVTAQYLQ